MSSPAGCSSQVNSTPVASSTRRVASASSGPVPSPGMNVTSCGMVLFLNWGPARLLASAYPGCATIARTMFGSGRSLPLLRVFGIRIGVNASWFLVLFLFIYWLALPFGNQLDDDTLGFVAAVAATLLFFGTLLLHELGH